MMKYCSTAEILRPTVQSYIKFSRCTKTWHVSNRPQQTSRHHDFNSCCFSGEHFNCDKKKIYLLKITALWFILCFSISCSNHETVFIFEHVTYLDSFSFSLSLFLSKNRLWRERASPVWKLLLFSQSNSKGRKWSWKSQVSNQGNWWNNDVCQLAWTTGRLWTVNNS